jgi:6-phosphogluconolactonase
MSPSKKEWAQRFDPCSWSRDAANLLHGSVLSILAEQGTCSVMLTGGRSAALLYDTWSSLPGFQQISGVWFYFGDERCVHPDHPESNYGMVMQTLFQQGVPMGCSVFRMEAEADDRNRAALRYEELLPAAIDVLLLGVGEDGHIASLFPNNTALQEQKRWVIPITGPKPPFDRLTITPPVIANARSVFVLAVGESKAAVLHSALNMPTDFDRLPARLALKATWLLDSVSPEIKI